MKFVMRVKQKGDIDDNAWEEALEDDFVKSVADIRKHCQHLVSNWNASSDSRHQRVLVDVVIDEVTAEAFHDWEKVNLFTIIDSSGAHDKYRCKRCGVDGKRYGVSPSIVRDRWCSAKVYERCDTAKKQIDKILEKRRQQGR